MTPEEIKRSRDKEETAWINGLLAGALIGTGIIALVIFITVRT